MRMLGWRGGPRGTTATAQRIHWPRWSRADAKTERVLRARARSGPVPSARGRASQARMSGAASSSTA